MSEYADFVNDFPSRSGELFRALKPGAEQRGREVTLLLAIAGTALTVPYERLRRRPDGSPYQHPSRDRERFGEVADQHDELLRSSFLASELVRSDRAKEHWRHGVVDNVDDLRDPLGAVVEMEELPRSRKTRDVLFVVRNALAHGNIATRGHQIRALRFFSSKFDARAWSEGDPRRFEFYEVTPAAFEHLVLAYCSFLAKLDIPQALIATNAA